MADVLVLVDHVDGVVGKPTLELLTLATRIGSPIAVVVGDGAGVAEKLGEYGATAVLSADDDALTSTVVAPVVSLLESLVAARFASCGAHRLDNRRQGDRRPPRRPS